MAQAYIRGLAAIWAGVVIGGSLIVAPAKFQVDTLSVPQLLAVGRVQFYWIGVAEAALCAALLLVTALSRRSSLVDLAVPVGLFAVQRLYLMPILDMRTLEIIAGTDVPPSSLHLAFIVLETTKVLVLCILALGPSGYEGSKHASQT